MRKIKTCKKFVRITLSASMAVITAMFKTAIPCYGWNVWDTTTSIIQKVPQTNMWYGTAEVSTPWPPSARYRGRIIVSRYGFGRNNITNATEFAKWNAPKIQFFADSGWGVTYHTSETCSIINGAPGVPLHALVTSQRIIDGRGVRITIEAGIESVFYPYPLSLYTTGMTHMATIMF